MQPPSRRRRRILIGLAAALALALALAAGWALLQRAPEDPGAVHCYSSRGDDAEVTSVDLGPGEQPIDACLRVMPGAFEGDAGEEAAVCVRAGEALSVYPNPEHLPQDTACRLAGADLPDPAARYGGLEPEAARALSEDIERRWHARQVRIGCVGHDDFIEEVNRAFRAAGADQWRVEDLTSDTADWIFPDGTRAVVSVPTTPDGQRCTDFWVAEGRATVVLVNGWPHDPEHPSPGTDVPPGSPAPLGDPGDLAGLEGG
jgi:hypothetical protein